ncbi:extracellular solute-binding protein [Caballeronia hypogeia]|uniref:Extracellular solute-binding protein n=1 Tax=Caballeronia hypogeia TaxID=1777140 RepID=A0A158CJJ2_9BURK|nr:ABC transporter substrate-binding protein [Caballeronia hypogeia]SAK82499.1 extracellular solute-binding protein [Caballeronia hypogeia]
MKRRVLTISGKAALLTALGLAAYQQANAADLVVAGFGAVFEDLIRQDVAPGFEKAQSSKITYVAGNSTDNLAKIIAQKGNEQIDVVMLDDGPMRQAVALGLCRPLESSSVYNNVYPSLKVYGNNATMIGVAANGLMYNTKVFKQNNWAPPTSWSDLKDPKYKGKVVFPPLSNGFGLAGFLAINRLGGGTDSNVEPAFKVFKADYAPNVAAFSPTPADMNQIFQAGEAVLAVNGSTRTAALADTGFPVAFVYPKEGAYAGGMAACAVAGGQNKPAAMKFVETLLSPESQTVIAKKFYAGPANSKVVLPPDLQSKVPYGESQISSLQMPDWNVVNSKRAEWTQQFNRIIQK